ncbi:MULTISPECIES: chorismate mutase [Lonsdalea]|uniref:Chorismate mutase n=2 Tax=Lonsdalea TaxID=1082702 RepID=A0ACD1JBU0_9GAMM|nr:MULTISPECIES: chorismate mutase [Lonsdalea]OSM97226.1 chorismate mutase [Lonsdalea populi]QPQ23851.1 chorismate mutase [Lonsdalea populi]RAT13139.1 chorismate mutase [Lonsdalea quercina]RAT16548.1 chorismate mutase [Lonsdalea quercina]RAT19590.1 chorismate mutase [Lonsdalea populi]
MLRKTMLLTLVFCCNAIAAGTSPVADLINQRLSYMKDVAADKMAHQRPIEDSGQEHNVLEISLRQAEKDGLDCASTAPFVQAQMDAAKAVQYRYRADWLSSPELNYQPLPLETVRARLTDINVQLLQQISVMLQQDGNLHRLTYARFAQSLTDKKLSVGDKKRLYATLQQIRLKH